MRQLANVVLMIGLVVSLPRAALAQDEASMAPAAGSLQAEIAKLSALSVADRPVTVETWNGTDWVARFDPATPRGADAIAAADSLVTAAGTSLDEVEVASASLSVGQEDGLVVRAVRIPGPRAYDLIDEALDVLVPDVVEPEIGWSWLANAWIAYFFDRADPDAGLTVVYPAADSIWTIDAEPARDEPIGPRVDPVVELLPPQPDAIGPRFALTQRVEAVDLGITASFPGDWTVEFAPGDPESQALMEQSMERQGLEGAWLGTLVATGPVDERLGAAPSCRLNLFDETQVTPSEWISRVVDGDRCYVVDETPDGLVRARIEPRDCGKLWAPSQGGEEHFATGSDSRIAYLTCWSKDPPGERGSAIAASIDFMPDES